MSTTSADRIKSLSAIRSSNNNSSSSSSKPVVENKVVDLSALSWADTVFSNIDQMQWADVVEMMTKESSKVEVHSFQGAEHPVVRREKMNGTFTAKHMIVFMGATRFRGFALSTYAAKTDSNAARIADMIKALDVKVPATPGARATGKYSPIGIVVSFSEVCISIQNYLLKHQLRLGNAMFGNEIFSDETNVMDPMYWFLGSLASMYHPSEEKAETRIQTLVNYCYAYDKFQDFYVDKRRAAAKSQKTTKSRVVATDEEIAAAKKRSRSYYLLTLSTFSLECRRAWYEGSYQVKPAQGDANLVNDENLVRSLASRFNCTIDEIRTPQGGKRR